MTYMTYVRLLVQSQARGFGWDSGQHTEPVFTADGTQTEEGVWPDASSGGQPVAGAGQARLRPQQQRITQQQGSEAESLSSAATGALKGTEAHIADATVLRWMPDGEAAVEPMNGAREAERVDSWSAASDTTAHAHDPTAALANTQAAPYAPVDDAKDQNNVAGPVEPADHAWQQQPSAAGGRVQDRSFFMDADRGGGAAGLVQLGSALAASACGGGHGHDAAPAGQTDDRGNDERANNAAG